MIAAIDFHAGTVDATAIMDDDGQWTCPPIPFVERMLNSLYAPIADPSLGTLGAREVNAAAAWLKGSIRWEEKTPPAPEPGVFIAY